MHERVNLVGNNVETTAFPVSARYFHENGLFAQLGATPVSQSLDVSPTSTDRDDFLVVDASIGYRFPNRRAMIALEFNNIFDEHFLYRDQEYLGSLLSVKNQPFIPDRSFLLRLTTSF